MWANKKGFTLVELLVALAIFAILAGFAYRSLQAMLDNREALQRETRKWRDIALFVGRIQRDLAAVLVTPGTQPTRRGMPISQAVPRTPGMTGDGIMLVRSGNVLQENALAAPQRVAWRLNDGVIERLMWTSADASPREEPAAVPVLASVSALEFRFLDTNGEWRRNWEPAPRVPAAVEVTLRLASGESIVRLVDIAQVGP